MEAAILFWLSVLFLSSDHANDPVTEAWRGRSHTRDLDCQRLSQAEAHRQHPGEVPPTNMRSSTIMELDALVCARRVVPWGERSPRDELILTHLTSETTSIAGIASGMMGGPAGAGARKVVVDVHYPQPQVAQKIATATRLALSDLGHTVSGSVPLLAAGDVAILTSVPLQQSLPIACQRYAAEGTLKDVDGRDFAMVMVAVLRDNESQLHAGLCEAGLPVLATGPSAATSATSTTSTTSTTSGRFTWLR